MPTAMNAYTARLAVRAAAEALKDHFDEDGDDAVDALARALVVCIEESEPVRSAFFSPFEWWSAGAAQAGHPHPHDAAAAEALADLGTPGSAMRVHGERAGAAWAERSAEAFGKYLRGRHSGRVRLPGAADALGLAADAIVIETSPEWETRAAEWQVNFAVSLACALWLGEVGDRVRAMRKNPPALTHGVQERLLEAHLPGVRLGEHDGRRVLLDSQGRLVGATVERADPLDVPAVEVESIHRLLPRGIELLGSVKAHRLLRWEVVTAHRQHHEGSRDARVVRVEGGWEALPVKLGLSPTSGAVEDFRRLVTAQAHLYWRWPDGTSGNMLSYTVRPAVGHRRAMVSLVLGDVLMPQYTHAITGNAASARASKRLVPIVDLPPFIGSPASHGAQASLQLALLGEMRVRAVELVEHGGVRFTNEEIVRLAGRVGLAGDLALRVLDRWTHDGDDGAAFLARLDGERFSLAAGYSSALRLLREGGERERRGAAWGRRGAARRNARFGSRRRRKR